MKNTSRTTFRSAASFAAACLILFSGACGDHAASHVAQDPAGGQANTGGGAAALAGCSFGPAERDSKGVARIALLVGVGAYQHSSINKLTGPPADVDMMHALLSGPGGFGFPEKNVCTLVDAAATGKNFRTAFADGLLKRAKKGDIVVIYFSGHGTQLPDTNHDESDLSDEVLMFVDSRTATENDLRDDEFAAMLKPLRTTSGNVVVILDSCNSGSGTRAASALLVPRVTPARPEDLAIVETTPAGAESDSSIYLMGAAPGLTTISAAIDGTVALEKASSGVFTKALVSVLSQVSAQPLTYRQLAGKVPPVVAATSTQIPSIESDQMDRVVFGATERTQPLALKVRSVGPPIKLGGTILPGIGRNAELRVFDSGATGTDLNDPKKSKGLLIVDSASGLNAEARLVSAPPNAAPIAPDDLAVLVRPSDDAIALQARIRPANEPGGVPADRAAKIRQALADNKEAAMLVKLGDALADFEVTMDASGRYNILGPEGRIRNVMKSESSVSENLWLHARQRAFLNLRSEGGAEYTDDSSLVVKLQPAARQVSGCVRKNAGLSRDDKGAYVVPLCYSWQVHVKLAPGVRGPVRVGGLILSSDGSVYGFPPKGTVSVIEAGRPEAVFDEVFVSATPLSINDYLLVYGTKMENWVDWALLSATALQRDATLPDPNSPAKGPLHRALDQYLRAQGTRGVQLAQAPYEDTAWTRTAITMRTEANPAFEGGLAAVNPGSREYTIKSFDIRPYLPDDTTTALYRVLKKADWLAQQDFSYKQHDWPAGVDVARDPAELAKGIDCSRAVWFAFTRSDVRYNQANDYLATVDMVKPNSRMNEEFERCPLGENYQTGDLLVYRDEQQGDGHVVMVIDPEKRIAWGSHGWDGNAKAFNVPPDTGVEYQLIKFKKDWKRWDRQTMGLSACWRYKGFTAERTRGLGQPGMAALGNTPCQQVCNN